MRKNILDQLEEDVANSNLSETEKQRMLKNVFTLREQKINIMITGATGCGKSSTINALFDTKKAKVGIGVDPETMDIKKYELNNLVLWDTPGLGDGIEKDITHAKNITLKLNEKDENGKALIDLVLVILDGGTRDLGTSYELINKVIIPNLGETRENRILVAINQADMAMKGKYWNHKLNKPEPRLIEFLNEKVKSVKNRIKEGSGIDVDPIYYCAGYTEEDGEQCKPYNLAKLLYYIIKNTPKEKRLVYPSNTNTEKTVWSDNDNLTDYISEIKKSLSETITECVAGGAKFLGEIGGKLFGTPGKIAGQILGGAVGGIIGITKGIISDFFGW